jgi:hypothetical protein
VNIIQKKERHTRDREREVILIKKTVTAGVRNSDLCQKDALLNGPNANDRSKLISINKKEKKKKKRQVLLLLLLLLLLLYMAVCL